MATGTPATAALTRAGVQFVLHPYEHDPRAEAYGEEAAAALGVAPERIFKTLITSVDGSLACGVVPVAGQLSLKALAAAVGGKKAVMADPALAARATGYVIGGISPIGQKGHRPIVVDQSAAAFATSQSAGSVESTSMLGYRAITDSKPRTRPCAPVWPSAPWVMIIVPRPPIASTSACVTAAPINSLSGAMNVCTLI